MKEKRILFLNYQREIPPFLVNEIRIASSIFDEVLYVSPKLYNDNRKLADFGKTKFVIGSKINEFVSFLLLPFLFLSVKSLKNVYSAIKHKNFKIKFLKHHLIQIYETRTLVHLAKKEIKKQDGTIVVSSWFNACAIASGVISKKKKVYSCSFAHAFEVQPQMNPYLGSDFDNFKFKNNSDIVFISKKVQTNYLSYMEKFNINEWKHKISQRYLGTFKDNHGLIDKRVVDSLHIVSCSSVVPVKRTNLIINILNELKSNVLWTHIGDGPGLISLKQAVEDLLKTKRNIQVNFVGSLPNSGVIKFYEENKIDLFINVSESEGLPVSIMEAYSFGIPVIATNVGGTSEIVDDKTGFLIEKDFNCKIIAKIIDDIYFKRIDIQQMSNECIKKWNMCFNIKNTGEHFYTHLLDKGRKYNETRPN